MNLLLPRTLRGRSAPPIALALFFGAICPESMAKTESATLVEDINARGESEIFLKTLCQPISFMVYSPDGSELCIRYRHDGHVVLHTSNWKNIRQLPRLRMAAYSPDSTLMATAEGKYGLRLWERGNDKPIMRLKGKRSSVLDVAFSPDGKVLASNNSEYEVDIWNPKTGELVQTLKKHNSPASLAFSNDGKRLYTADDISIKIWDTSTWKEMRSIHTPDDAGPVKRMVLSSDDATMASVHIYLGVMIWDTSSWLARVQRKYYSAAFSPDGKELAVGGKDILLWDIHSGRGESTAELRETIRVPVLNAEKICPDEKSRNFPMEIREITYAPNGKTLAAGCRDGTIIFLER